MYQFPTSKVYKYENKAWSKQCWPGRGYRVVGPIEFKFGAQAHLIHLDVSKKSEKHYRNILGSGWRPVLPGA